MHRSRQVYNIATMDKKKEMFVKNLSKKCVLKSYPRRKKTDNISEHMY